MSGVTYILDDLDYYAQAYQTFTRCSAKTGAIGDWVDRSFTNSVVGKLVDKVKIADPLRVLGIGSGAGNIDCAMLQKLLPFYPKVDSTIVEPSGAQITLFKNLIEDKGDALKGVTFDWRQETSDQFLDTVNNQKKFHLIHAVHVLYYAKDLKKTLQMLYDLLEEGGLLFIIILSRDSTINKVHVKMNEIQEGIRPLLLTDEQLTSALDSLDLSYTSECVLRYIQGTSIFEENSPDGHHLLDFLTHSKDFRKSAPDSLIEGVLECLQTPQCSKEQNGEVLIFRHWVHVTIAK